MSTALATIQADELDTIQRTATLLVASGYFDAKGDRNTQIAQIATKIMAGRELGYAPFTAVQGIHIIQGKPQVSANLMAAAVKAHPRYDYRVTKMADSEVAIDFFENGQRIGVSTFTIDDAKKAGTQNVQKFPRNMLFARALSNGVRWYCPDVFYGNSVYVEGEIGEMEMQQPSVIVVDKTTGEVVEGPDAPPADFTLADVDPLSFETDPIKEWAEIPGATPTRPDRPTWHKPADAYAWAIESGACANEFEAKNSLKKITDEQFGGKLTGNNLQDAFDRFHARQVEKLAAAAA